MRVIKQSDYFNYYDQFHTPMQHIIIYLYLLYIYISQCYFAVKWWMRMSATLHNLCNHLHPAAGAVQTNSREGNR